MKKKMTISTNACQPTCLTTTAQGNKKMSSTSKIKKIRANR
jgi:hypothetical protein